ncbi:MAG TPA: HesA/MoeB/ThiF family protein [Methanospirillum sp.]|nr:HesA/MoeB/ThiF family protein [Methanospirillum sp.]
MTSERYIRQIPLFGSDGQEKLLDSCVLVAGAGGLGSPAATYLALAGVGEIIIADADVVDETNLNRQFLHATSNIGLMKVYSAASTLKALNPDISISACPESITSGTINGLVRDADIIVDAVDNYETRYVLNQAAIEHQIPLVHGAVEGFSGQMTTIIPGKTPCLACIIPESPPKRITPIIGATAGVIGSLQAMEVIKCITGTGTLLSGRLMIWDGSSGRTDYITLKQRSDCAVCTQEGT